MKNNEPQGHTFWVFSERVRSGRYQCAYRLAAKCSSMTGARTIDPSQTTSYF